MKIYEYSAAIFIWSIAGVAYVQCSDVKDGVDKYDAVMKLHGQIVDNLKKQNVVLLDQNKECLALLHEATEELKKKERNIRYWRTKYVRWQNRVEKILDICIFFSAVCAIYEWYNGS